MIVPAVHLSDVFQALKQDAKCSEDQAILCFASSTDADSVCASQELLSLFKKEDIDYSLVPVRCYEDIRAHCEPLVAAQENKTLMFINCGATEDVRSLCELPPNIRIIILDKHRPVWHGHNNDEDQDTLVLVDDDDPVPKAAVPIHDPFADQLTGEESEDTEEDEEQEDEEDRGEEEEEDDGEEDASPGRKRRRAGADASTSQPSKRGPPGGGGGPADRAAARRERRAAMRQRAELIDNYYNSKNGYGKPSSVVLFALCHQLQHTDYFHVWCAIVGLTEQVVFQQISKQQYMLWRKELADYVGKLEVADAEAVKDGVVISNNNVYVQRCSDFRLTLLRQWTIEESLRYSCYVAARLQTWRQKGLENVWALLLVMCIPLKHATIPFKGVRDVYAEQLQKQLPVHGPRHMLAWDALQLDSFRLLYKHEEVSASDMVFALMGLLSEPPAPDAASRGHIDAFNRATDALHLQRHLNVVEQGMEAAKRLCMDIVHECGLMVTAGKVVGGKTAPYRFVNLNDTYTSNVGNDRFSHPITLRYMALFLRDAANQRFVASDARRPMVVAGPPDAEGYCCVVAVHAKHISGNILQSNPFARPFLETLSALDLQQGRASFDNSVYHLHKEVVGQFLSKLKDVVQEYQAVLPAGPAAGAATGQAPAQKGARRRRGGGEAIAAGAP